MSTIFHQFLSDIQQTSLLEFIAVVFGIASVIFSRLENILVYPTGMINTAIFIYLYITHGLYADATVNLYYTVMSISGWVLWARKKDGQKVLFIPDPITGTGEMPSSFSLLHGVSFLPY